MSLNWKLFGNSNSINAINLLDRITNILNARIKFDEGLPQETLHKGSYQVLLEYADQQYVSLVGADSESECREIIADMKLNIPVFKFFRMPAFITKEENYTFTTTANLKENYFDQFCVDENENASTSN